MKKVLLVLLCVLLAAGGIVMFISLLEANQYAKDTLESCCVSTGGGMRGGLREVRLYRDEDGTPRVSFSEKETHADRLVTTVYQAKEEDFAHVSELAVRFRLFVAAKLPYSKMRALDADTTTVSFYYVKKDFQVSQEQVMSPKMREGFRAVCDYLSSLAAGEGVTTKESQKAVLHLRSGYTLQFEVQDVFDGRLDAILGQEHEVSPYQTTGIVLAKGDSPELSGAEKVSKAAAGDIVYSLKEGSIILLYADGSFPEGAYVLARLSGYVPSAAPLIAEMQGPYSLSLN